MERRSVDISSYMFSVFSKTISCGLSGLPWSSRSLGIANTTMRLPEKIHNGWDKDVVVRNIKDAFNPEAAYSDVSGQICCQI